MPLQGLQFSAPIVDTDGCPTLAFQRQWQEMVTALNALSDTSTSQGATMAAYATELALHTTELANHEARLTAGGL